MRVRKPFAAAFLGLVVFAAFAGLAPSQYKIPDYGQQSDKVLHFLTFFIITLCFYWVIETSRRRVIHITLVVCTLGLCVGSEFLQHVLPNAREFDMYDIVANLIGSLAALGLCAWYHKRMLDRRRAAKSYHTVPGDDLERDVELGEGVGEQETGVTRGRTVEEELENWDENEVDWESTEPTEMANGDGDASKTGDGDGKEADGKKRGD